MASHLFVVGPSRSGTTMMARLIGRAEGASDLGELHFLEQSFPGDRFAGDELLNENETRRLAARIQAIVNSGYFFADKTEIPEEQTRAALGGDERLSAKQVYARVTRYEADRKGGTVPIDQTPRNVFYMDEILKALPEARIVAMVRDPRDVLLSQKRRWKRRSLGGNVPLLWTMRSWANYHPMVLTRLWRAGATAMARSGERPEVLVVRYEDILAEPEATIRKVCDHCGVPFQAEILDVDQVGSSTASDSRGKGIDATNRDKWRKGLSPAEIAICEANAGSMMAEFGYAPSGTRLSLGGRVKYAFLLPAKAAVAIPLQLNRIASLGSFLRKRVVG